MLFQIFWADLIKSYNFATWDQNQDVFWLSMHGIWSLDFNFLCQYPGTKWPSSCKTSIFDLLQIHLNLRIGLEKYLGLLFLHHIMLDTTLMQGQHYSAWMTYKLLSVSYLLQSHDVLCPIWKPLCLVMWQSHSLIEPDLWILMWDISWSASM